MAFVVAVLVSWLALSLVVAVTVGTAITEASRREHRTPCGPVALPRPWSEQRLRRARRVAAAHR